jgi:thioredoxin 1
MTDKVEHMNDENFASLVEKGVVLVDFFADWCGPCKMMEPVVKQLAEDMAGQVTVAKIDIESSQQTTAEYHVTSIPTLIIFKQGLEVERIVGVKDLESLKKLVRKHI